MIAPFDFQRQWHLHPPIKFQPLNIIQKFLWMVFKSRFQRNHSHAASERKNFWRCCLSTAFILNKYWINGTEIYTFGEPQALFFRTTQSEPPVKNFEYWVNFRFFVPKFSNSSNFFWMHRSDRNSKFFKINTNS